jgi:hypothetical protein
MGIYRLPMVLYMNPLLDASWLPRASIARVEVVTWIDRRSIRCTVTRNHSIISCFLRINRSVANSGPARPRCDGMHMAPHFKIAKPEAGSWKRGLVACLRCPMGTLIKADLGDSSPKIPWPCLTDSCVPWADANSGAGSYLCLLPRRFFFFEPLP